MGTFEADIAASQAIIDAQEAYLLGLPAEARVISVDELRARVPPADLQASDDAPRYVVEARRITVVWSLRAFGQPGGGRPHV
jgi:hypothetical protein